MHKSNCRDAFRRAPDSLIDFHTGYNWYEPGASLRRHGDEFHEETKGPKRLAPAHAPISHVAALSE